MTIQIARLAVALMVVAFSSPAAARLQSPFEPFAFLVGSCWQGTFPRSMVTDEHCFEWLHDGKFLRDQHVVRGGPQPYAGETTYAWDAKAGRVVYWYISSDGNHSSGHAEVRNGVIVFPETHVSAAGTRELLNFWQRTGPDSYRIRVLEKTADGERELWHMDMQRVRPK